MADRLTKVGETEYHRGADRTYDIFKGKNLYFLDYNDQGLYYTIYAGKTIEECWEKWKVGDSIHDYSNEMEEYQKVLNEDDEDPPADPDMDDPWDKAWERMEKKDKALDKKKKK